MRLIDADSIPYTMLYKENWHKGTGVEAQGVFKSDIDKMPTIEERKTGKWIKHDYGTWACSVCQSWIPNEQHYYARFCLHCGAKMERR